MTQKEDTRTEGRGRGPDAGLRKRTLYFLCIVSCGGVIYRFTSHTDRRPSEYSRPQALQFPWHYTAAAESIPPSLILARATCRLRRPNRLAECEKTIEFVIVTRQTERSGEDFTERKEGGMDGG